jgi:hypothetical protein
MGCLYLQGAVAERGRELKGLPAHRYGAVEVSREPEYHGHPGQHSSQPGPIVERPGQGLGLTQQGEAPPMLSQCVQWFIQSEAQLEGQSPGVAVLGEVREGLEGLLEGGHRLAECGAVVSPGASLLTVGDGPVPHLIPQGMVRQACDLLVNPLWCEHLYGLDKTRVQPPPLL